MAVYLGIDTSFYTTSLAAVDGEGRLVLDLRRALAVRKGARGLQPSLATFEHLKILPELIEEAFRAGIGPVGGVAASVRPRAEADSYLPVFRAGVGFGRSLAAALGIPFRGFTHQEGHLRAGDWSAGGPRGSFLAWHLSGGTTDLLRVERVIGGGYLVSRLGGTTDLHAGQFLDRVGVALGLDFPAGPALERLASGAGGDIPGLPVAVRGGNISFSGPAAAAERLIAAGYPAAAVAAAAQECVVESVRRATAWAIMDRGAGDVLVVGGVAANARLREVLAGATRHAFFGEPRFCSDNAVGTALLALDAQAGLSIEN